MLQCSVPLLLLACLVSFCTLFVLLQTLCFVQPLGNNMDYTVWGGPPQFFFLHVVFNPMTPGRVHCQRCESAANVLCFCISPPIHDFVANLAEFFFPGRHFLCQSFGRHDVELCHFAFALREPNSLPMPPIPTTGICMHPHRLTRTVNAPLTVDMLTAPRWACKRPRGMITNPGQGRSTIAGLAPDLTVPIGMWLSSRGAPR